jgi:spore germination cell wall hydrolase CwlJ-like protein
MRAVSGGCRSRCILGQSGSRTGDFGGVCRLPDLVEYEPMTMLTRVLILFGLCLVPLAAKAEVRLQQSLVRALSAEREAMRQIDVNVTDRATRVVASAEHRYDRDWLLSRPSPARSGAEFMCLKEAIYHESRGEDILGQFAVAEVILNRVDSPFYPDTICGVVHQNAHRVNACQFSYACNGRSRAMADRQARAIAAQIADILLAGAPRELTDGATHFHARRVSPDWSRTYDRTARIGEHIFYRQPPRN